MRNTVIKETKLLADALARIAKILPATWQVKQYPGKKVGGRRIDAIVELIGPNGFPSPFAAEVKSSGVLPTATILATLRDLATQTGQDVLFVSDFIGPTLRQTLVQSGFSYADPTGWVRITADDPLILLTSEGAQRAPKQRNDSAVRRLNGVAAGRTIRALATSDLPIGVRDLARIAGVSPGSVSKLLETLAAEGVVDRNERGAVIGVQRRDLIQRWTRDYSFAKSNTQVGYFIAPRGLDRLAKDLQTQSGVAVTGSGAARQLLPKSIISVVPLRLQALYSSNPTKLANELGLIPAETTNANVMIAVPQDLEILPTTGVTLAPLPLVLADLITLPGRGDSESEQLLDSLAKSDGRWKE